jgi:hypothetical protein
MDWLVIVTNESSGESRELIVDAPTRATALVKVLRRSLFAEWLVNGGSFTFTVGRTER